jgi:hypothetical protein
MAYQDYNDELERHSDVLQAENKNMGASSQWTEPGQTPRPDKSIADLKWMSWLGFLGLDHFYLRSPLTGLAKLLTLGGVGIWWIWDILQVYTETDRVVKFGLSLPFDLKLGIAQGMITDHDPEYAQRSSFSWWQLASMFGFVGADSFLLGKWGQGARKITEFIILLVGVITLAVAWNENGISGLISFGKIITILIVVFFGGMVFGNWGLSLSTIFTPPQELFKTGIVVSPKTNEALNSYTSFLNLLKGLLGEETVEQVKADMNYGSVAGAEFKKKFEIETKEVLEQEAAAAAATQTDESDTKWLKSFFIWLGMVPLFGFQLIVSVCKWIYYAVFPMAALASESTKIAIKKAEKVGDILSKQLDEAAKIGDLRALESIGIPSLIQAGGARRSGAAELSTEAKVLGAAVIAIAGGGALKVVIDSLVAE